MKAIIFDFWGTLVNTGVWSPVKQVRNILGIKVAFPEYIVRMEKAMMTKKFDSLQEAFESVCKEFKLQCEPRRLDSLIGMWNKSWMLAQPYEEVASTLSDLNEYQLILVSNTDSMSIPKVLEKFELDKYFQKKYFSFERNALKTEKKFMEHVLKDLQLKPEDCLFVGDSIQSDMKAAELVGIKGVLIDRKNQRDFNPKINNLQEINNHL